VLLHQEQSNNPDMKVHAEAANVRPLQESTKPNLSAFVAKTARIIILPPICMHGMGANSITERAEHKQQQQPHNEAVNKGDALPSLCFPANLQNGLRAPFRGR